MGALANLETKTISVQPGAVASVRIRVQNTGQVVDEFTLQVLGDAAGWALVAPPTISLFPGKDEIATVTFRPPKAAQTKSGSVPFGIRVQSREDPPGSVVEEGTLSVGTFGDTGAELVPRTSRGSRGATHEVAVDNRGNAQLAVALSAGDKDKVLEFTVRPASLLVAPGTAGFARVRVRPKQSFFTGAPKSKAFQVLVQPEGQPPITLDGSLTQGPLLAPWMIPAALGVVGLLIAAVILWFVLVKPAIQTAAINAVTTPSASQGGGGATPGRTLFRTIGGAHQRPGQRRQLRAEAGSTWPNRVQGSSRRHPVHHRHRFPGPGVESRLVKGHGLARAKRRPPVGREPG